MAVLWVFASSICSFPGKPNILSSMVISLLHEVFETCTALILESFHDNFMSSCLTLGLGWSHEMKRYSNSSKTSISPNIHNFSEWSSSMEYHFGKQCIAIWLQERKHLTLYLVSLHWNISYAFLCLQLTLSVVVIFSIAFHVAVLFVVYSGVSQGNLMAFQSRCSNSKTVKMWNGFYVIRFSALLENT